MQEKITDFFHVILSRHAMSVLLLPILAGMHQLLKVTKFTRTPLYGGSFEWNLLILTKFQSKWCKRQKFSIADIYDKIC